MPKFSAQPIELPHSATAKAGQASAGKAMNFAVSTSSVEPGRIVADSSADKNTPAKPACGLSQPCIQVDASVIHSNIAA